MKTDRNSRCSSKAPFVTGIALAVSIFIFGGVNNAVAIPVAVVADIGLPTSIMTQINTYVQQLNMIAERTAEVQREIERVTNLATQATSLLKGLSPNAFKAPTRRPDDHGMKRCDPDFSGFSMSDLFQLLVPSLGSSIPEQQRTLCKQIVALENAKYNQNFDTKLVVKERLKEIADLSNELRSSDTTGKNMSNMGQAQIIMNTLIAEVQLSESTMSMYESQIASLKDDQKYLAEEALSGKKKSLGESLLATGAQTAALCGGLLAVKSAGSTFDCIP